MPLNKQTEPKSKVEQSRELAIEKGAFGSPSTMVADFPFFFYLLYKYFLCKRIFSQK